MGEEEGSITRGGGGGGGGSPIFPPLPFGKKIEGFGIITPGEEKEDDEGGEKKKPPPLLPWLTPQDLLGPKEKPSDNGEKKHALFLFFSLSSPHPFIQAGSRNERGGEKISFSGRGHTNMAFFSSPLFADL